MYPTEQVHWLETSDNLPGVQDDKTIVWSLLCFSLGRSPLFFVVKELPL